MKKFVNFRPFLFLFLISIISVYCCVKINISKLYLLFIVLPFIFFVYLIYKKKFVFLSFSLLVVVFLSCYSYFYVKNFTNKFVNNSYYVIYANVNQINKVSSNFYYLTLNNAIGSDEHGVKSNINGNISLGVYDYDGNFNLQTSDKVLFETYLTSTNFFNEDGEVNSFYVKNNIRFIAKNSNYTAITAYKGEQPLTEQLKNYNKTLLIENFGEETGELAFAILYGDKTSVSKDLLTVFKFSGVIHLFAVSGLHVSLIVLLVYFILKKLKANNLTTFLICFVFLLLFCYLCSFTPSIVRASIMALTLLFSKLLYRKNDVLNSLGFAGVILLLFNPLNLFDGGFQMSFLAVFALITLGSLFLKIKIKNGLIKKIVVLVLTTLSVQVSLIPITTKFYGFLPTWSLLSNLVSIPLFSIFYPILFILNLFVLICPFCPFLYVLPKALLYVLIYINSVINMLPYSIINVTRFGLLFGSVFVFLQFYISKYNLTNKKFKVIIASVVAISLLVVGIMLNLQ